MKIKKHIKFKDGSQVWRILISPTGKLIIETRNTDKKVAFFTCYELGAGKRIFKSFQFEEKYWIGIEDLYKDLILFHKFAKPDMPGHKSIIAFDVISQKVKWENPDYSFLFVYDNKIYCFSQMFEGRNFYTLNPESGELIDNLGTDAFAINKLKYEAEVQKDYSDYIFPQPLYENSSPEINTKNLTRNVEPEGNVDFIIFDDYIFANYHYSVVGNLLENKFVIFNLADEEFIHEEILNSAVNSYVPDSFFIYKSYLILLKEKSEVIVYKLD